MDHFLFNVPRLLVGTKSDLRTDAARIAELRANGQQLISVEQVITAAVFSVTNDDQIIC